MRDTVADSSLRFDTRRSRALPLPLHPFSWRS
jgi:hypothetical protein